MTNIFASSVNVGQLFDALWFNATEAVKASQTEEGQKHPAYLQRARELAIGDAHKRYLELTDS